jgi:hypothetical protein
MESTMPAPPFSNDSLAVLRLVQKSPHRVAKDAPGLAGALQRGYVTHLGGLAWVQITDTGRAFLAGVDFVVEAM